MRPKHKGRQPYSGAYQADFSKTNSVRTNNENVGANANFLTPNRFKPYTDSGMVTNYQAAVHQKPVEQLNSIQKLFNKMIGYVPPAQTTQQGSAASSPSVAQFLLYSLRYERWQVIADCNNIYADDGRVHQSVDMFVEEAVRKGVLVTVTDKGGRATRRLNQKAQQIIDGVVKLMPTSFFEACGKATIVEGELFWHISTYGDKVINIERRPASAMERNTDDADEFIDVNRAFSQIDTTSTAEVATYPLWQIWHGRWNYMDGDRYGTSSLACIRRLYRLLEMAEDAQIRRRLVRAPQRKHWKIGTPEYPGQKKDVDALRNEIGGVEGNLNQYDPVNTAIDYFSTNQVECQVLNGDGTVHEIEDLKYFENVFSSALPTPGAIYNLASSDVNRDVLEDQRAQWLNRTRKLNDFFTSGIRYVIDIALMLGGIDPDTISYSVHWSESNTETSKDRTERVLLLLNNGIVINGNFIAKPLLSHRKAMSIIADDYDIADVDAELAAINEDLKQNIGALVIPQAMPTMPVTTKTAAGKTTTSAQPAPTIGTAPSGSITSGSSSVVKPVTAKEPNLNKPKLLHVTPEQPINTKRSLDGSLTGAGQSASPLSEMYGQPKELPEGY